MNKNDYVAKIGDKVIYIEDLSVTCISARGSMKKHLIKGCWYEVLKVQYFGEKYGYHYTLLEISAGKCLYPSKSFIVFHRGYMIEKYDLK